MGRDRCRENERRLIWPSSYDNTRCAVWQAELLGVYMYIVIEGVLLSQSRRRYNCQPLRGGVVEIKV
ncbi:hypothetical protein F442_12405 [Phytophthora nicotianae P10297]|uniref:Uncharacterized protein n=2 Tax=Phytophthora nicotianae TaxID=4792 RepID=V9EWF6_PHYNI|nr:hypothetical protein F443_12492 [Phytophthora nicotianae P1569]ETP40224.1 hypothetical protein F442_12405 [Phytophthora nicotianae P10297]